MKVEGAPGSGARGAAAGARCPESGLESISGPRTCVSRPRGAASRHGGAQPGARPVSGGRRGAQRFQSGRGGPPVRALILGLPPPPAVSLGAGRQPGGLTWAPRPGPHPPSARRADALPPPHPRVFSSSVQAESGCANTVSAAPCQAEPQQYEAQFARLRNFLTGECRRPARRAGDGAPLGPRRQPDVWSVGVPRARRQGVKPAGPWRSPDRPWRWRRRVWRRFLRAACLRCAPLSPGMASCSADCAVLRCPQCKAEARESARQTPRVVVGPFAGGAVTAQSQACVPTSAPDSLVTFKISLLKKRSPFISVGPVAPRM